jgi:hypothetical protein
MSVNNLFSESDFTKMRFIPFGVKKPMLKLYPRLEEVVTNISHGLNDDGVDKVLKYIAFMYDPETPLREKYPDVERRKEFALTLAGFDLDTDTTAHSLTAFDEEWMADVVVNYLVLINNRLWTLIVTNEQTFYEYAKRLVAPVQRADGDKDKDVLQGVQIKSKIMEDMDKINDRLTAYYRQISGEDDLMTEVVSKRKRVTPEMMAKMKKEAQDV